MTHSTAWRGRAPLLAPPEHKARGPLPAKARAANTRGCRRLSWPLEGGPYCLLSGHHWQATAIESGVNILVVVASGGRVQVPQIDLVGAMRVRHSACWRPPQKFSSSLHKGPPLLAFVSLDTVVNLEELRRVSLANGYQKLSDDDLANVTLGGAFTFQD